METRLQYPIAIDVLAANNKNCVDEWTYRSPIMENKGLENSTWTIPTRQGSTGRVANHRNTEIIRKTMLLHEDIFKRQVRELHRLCSVQRMIMEEIKIQAKPPWQRDQHENQEAHGSLDGGCGLDLTLSIGVGSTGSTSSTKHTYLPVKPK